MLPFITPRKINWIKMKFRRTREHGRASFALLLHPPQVLIGPAWATEEFLPNYKNCWASGENKQKDLNILTIYQLKMTHPIPKTIKGKGMSTVCIQFYSNPASNFTAFKCSPVIWRIVLLLLLSRAMKTSGAARKLLHSLSGKLRDSRVLGGQLHHRLQ